MDENNYFSIKSVFGQLISFIPNSIITQTVNNHNSDRYVKHFKSQDHFFSMLFCVLQKCNLLREVAQGMLALSDKKESFGINHIPKEKYFSRCK